MTQKELNEVLDKHRKWLNNEDGGEYADLSYVDLSNTDLRYANLAGADLTGTNLLGSDMRNANLSCARMGDINLSDANLWNANLSGANLIDADLTLAFYPDTILNLQCPEEGSFIAWKKLRYDMVAKLLIPEDAKRSSATSRKCRASKAIVLAIYDAYGTEINEGISNHDKGFIYRVGETVYPDSWDEDRWNECSNGIHFFITRGEAEEYEH